jgi:hypothetical protein
MKPHSERGGAPAASEALDGPSSSVVAAEIALWKMCCVTACMGFSVPGYIFFSLTSVVVPAILERGAPHDYET